MTRLFASHPTAANLLMVLMIVLGVVALPSLRRETFPDFATSTVEVSVVYPGASADEVEEAVCNRIGDAVDGISFVEEVVSEAREGRGSVVVEMADGADFQIFLDDIRTEIDAIGDFPELAEEPVIKALDRTDQVVSIAVVGDLTPQDLKTYCEDLKEELKQRTSVSQVDISGFPDRRIQIELSADRLNELGLGAQAVANIVGSQSIDLPAGTIESIDRDYIIRFTDERRTPREYEDLVIMAGPSGAELKLGDIARITDSFEIEEEKILFNGKRAGVLQITKNKTEDALDIFDDIEGFLDEKRQTAPAGMEFILTYDVSSVVRSRLLMLAKNGWQGLLLVFLAMWFFFSFRLSFWVVMGLPVSFLGAFFLMPVVGLSVNMVTMVGLLLALGLLMDDAIVIAENVATHVKKGSSALKAVIEGVAEVKIGVLYSFLTTVCIFGPLCLLEGNMGKVLKAMPLVLILVLSVSLLEAFLILPHHLASSLRSESARKTNRLRRGIDAGVGWVRERVLGRAVDFAIRWRYAFLGVVVMVFVVSVGMVASGVIKFQSFPEIDGDVVECRILLPQGTPLATTERVVDEVTGALDGVNERFAPLQPGGKMLVRNVSVRFGVNPMLKEFGGHTAVVVADLLGCEDRNARLDDVLDVWREEVGVVADVVCLQFTEPVIGPAGKAIDIRLSGSDLRRLDEAAAMLVEYLKGFEGVSNVMDDLRLGKPELRMRLKEGAYALGLTAREIASQLRVSLYGATTDEIQVGNESYEINVRLLEDRRDSLADLEGMYITTMDSSRIPLLKLVDVEESRGWSSVRGVNGRRTVTVQADVDPHVANAAEITRKVKKEEVGKLEEFYPGLDVSFQGDAKESGKTGGSLIRGFLIGLLGVFILLSFQFRSYFEPIIVMVNIPLAFVGVICGHMLMGLELSMPSMVGFVSLAGIAVNDSLLLVEFVKRRRRTMPPAMAAAQASRDRFRAVLITSVTTIAGLLPLLMETSLQAQIMIPLVTSVVFGLLFSTLLVLLVVPCFYMVLDDFGLARQTETPTNE